MARDFQRRAQPVNRHWTGFSGSAFAQAAGTVGVLISAAQHDRETLMRTRGNLYCQLDGVNAPGVLGQVAVGFIKVPEGTGTTVLWSPFTDSDAPWFWYESFVLGYEEAVTDVVSYPGGGMFRSVIDSKAMRKFRNEEVQMVIENTSLLAAIEYNLNVVGRFLTQE